MVYAQPSTCPGNDTLKFRWNFDLQTDYLISARRPDLLIINNNNKKREFAKLSILVFQADHSMKLKEFEKKDKYLDFAREVKKLWNM